MNANEFDIPDTIEGAIRTVAEGLKTSGVENPRLDARLIVSYAAGVPPETYLIQPKRELDASTRDRAAGLMMRRMLREPMSHILGEREFWSMSFEVTPDTLTPRPDTECLVEHVLRKIKTSGGNKEVAILDIGTGSGCILLALLSELPSARGVGVDINPEALSVAIRNAERHGLADRTKFAVSDCFDAVQGTYDVIVSNPPYIRTAEMTLLEPEVVKHEPVIALDGGEDGLCFYRELCAKAPAYLQQGGILAVEVGDGQAAEVSGLMERAGFSKLQTFQDLAGRNRAVMATYA